MKKTLLFFIIVGFAINCVKSQTTINSNILSPTKKITFDKSLLLKNKNTFAKSSTITNQGWFNYGTESAILFGATSDYSSNYLFPDSLGYVDFSGTIAPIWIHHIAELIDFDSPIFSLNPATSWVATSSSSTFNIDSLSLFYAYTRNHPNSSIVDTLIITLYDNSTPSNLSLNGMTGVGAYNYGVDTFSYQMIGYNPLSNIICAPTATTSPQITPIGAYQFKVLLTTNDTAITAYREKKFSLPTPFPSSRNNLVIANVSFKPGYSYYLTQQIDLTANSFQFVSSEENGNAGGTGSFMNHIDCNFGSTQCDYSMSYILPRQVRYSMATSWDYRYIPSIAYTEPYQYEHHLISFHITDTTVIPCLANANFIIIADTLNPGVYNAYETSTGNGVLSYLWDFGDGTSSTLQYPNHQYAIPGQYIVCLTVTSAIGTNTCSDTYCDSSSVQKMAAGFLMSQFNVIAPIVTNTNETEKSIEIKAYPNPISDELVIEFTHKDFERLNYELIDAIGRVVLSNSFEKGKTTINTSQLCKGFYNLNIINADGNKIKSLKIIK
jgi:PKD repeat protein